jgi:Domain of unknown function (DUF4403)
LPRCLLGFISRFARNHGQRARHFHLSRDSTDPIVRALAQISFGRRRGLRRGNRLVGCASGVQSARPAGQWIAGSDRHHEAAPRLAAGDAPVAVALTAIARAVDADTPREFAGKNDNPVTQLLRQAQIGLTVTRGTMSVSGQSNTLSIITPLNGSVRITGQIGATAGRVVGGIGGALGDLIGGNALGKQVDNFAAKTLDQRTDFRGNVVVTSRPQLTPAWRIEPNLAGRLDLTETGTNIAGIRVNVGSEIKPVLDPIVSSQIAALQSRLRNDATIERSAREQWSRMCRSIPLGGDKTGLPPLWLEMRPVRAAAAQPQIDGRNLTITIGVQAETRILPNDSKPNCPFPARLELVPPMQDGVIAVGVPIDMPFAELNRLIESQLKGRHFPEDGSGPVDIQVLRESLGSRRKIAYFSARKGP